MYTYIEASTEIQKPNLSWRRRGRGKKKRKKEERKKVPCSQRLHRCTYLMLKMTLYDTEQQHHPYKYAVALQEAGATYTQGRFLKKERESLLELLASV